MKNPIETEHVTKATRFCVACIVNGRRGIFLALLDSMQQRLGNTDKVVLVAHLASYAEIWVKSADSFRGPRTESVGLQLVESLDEAPKAVLSMSNNDADGSRLLWVGSADSVIAWVLFGLLRRDRPLGGFSLELHSNNDACDCFFDIFVGMKVNGGAPPKKKHRWCCCQSGTRKV